MKRESSKLTFIIIILVITMITNVIFLYLLINDRMEIRKEINSTASQIVEKKIIELDNSTLSKITKIVDGLNLKSGVDGKDGIDGKDGVVDVEYINKLVSESVNKSIGNINISNGASAYDLAVKFGFKGSEEQWIESLQGKPVDPIVPIIDCDLDRNRWKISYDNGENWQLISGRCNLE